MNGTTLKTSGVVILALVAGFAVGMQTSGRYTIQPSGNAAYVYRLDKLTGHVKAELVDLSAFRKP